MLPLLSNSFNILLIDIDNTLFTAGSIGKQKKSEQRLYLIILIIGEFIMRLLLLWVFGWLISGNEPLFYIGDLPVTAEKLSLFVAGAYLVINSIRDLVGTFGNAGEPDGSSPELSGGFLRRAGEGILVLSIMSIDTVLVMLNMTDDVAMMLYLILFSALVRLLFVQGIAGVVQRYPGIRLFVIFLLGIIGLELIAQGLGFNQEEEFNILVLLALLIAVIYQLRHGREKDRSEREI